MAEQRILNPWVASSILARGILCLPSLKGVSLAEPVLQLQDVDSRLKSRWLAIIDILYLTQVTWLYLLAAIYPFVGILYGILLLAGGIDPKTKRIGRVCLIIGIINTALVIAILIVVVIVGLAGTLAAVRS